MVGLSLSFVVLFLIHVFYEDHIRNPAIGTFALGVSITIMTLEIATHLLTQGTINGT